MCIMGPGKKLFETWKSSGNLFLKKGTNHKIMSVVGLGIIRGKSFTRFFLFLLGTNNRLHVHVLYNLAAYPRCMLILLIVDK